MRNQRQGATATRSYSLHLCALILLLALLGEFPQAALNWWQSLPPTNYNRLAEQPVSHCPHGCEVALAEPEEFDFLSEAEVLKRRAAAVARDSELLDGTYRPFSPIFGQITDGKPWWGLWGLYSAGPGAHGPDGPSEETRFILNPFLLVGAIEQYSFPSGILPEELPPHYYPTPTRLLLDPARHFGSVDYDLRGFSLFLARYNSSHQPSQAIHLVAYNARDLGFSTLALSKAHSINLGAETTFDRPITIRQFIHTGGSCGRKEGCNNMSPTQNEFNVRIESFPATLEVKLWRNPPPNASTPGDFLFVLQLQG